MYASRSAKDKTLCEQVIDVDQKGECLGKVAGALNDKSICEKANNEACWVFYASDSKDETVCEKLTSSAKKSSCKFFATN